MRKHLITRGIGLQPGSARYVVTLGMGMGTSPLGTIPPRERTIAVPRELRTWVIFR